MFYLRILVFCQVSTGTISKRPQILPFIFLQVFICCLNPGIGYCLGNKLRCILVEDSSACSMSPLSAKQNRFYKKTKSERALKKLVLQEYKFRKGIKEAYPEIVPHCPLSISIGQ
jgi:hypothetical protein